jgi:hypothetical protein
MTHMEKDWLEDDSLSAEETMRRFRALRPQPTVGPSFPKATRTRLVRMEDYYAEVAAAPGTQAGPSQTFAEPATSR